MLQSRYFVILKFSAHGQKKMVGIGATSEMQLQAVKMSSYTARLYELYAAVGNAPFLASLTQEPIFCKNQLLFHITPVLCLTFSSLSVISRNNRHCNIESSVSTSVVFPFPSSILSVFFYSVFTWTMAQHPCTGTQVLWHGNNSQWHFI